MNSYLQFQHHRLNLWHTIFPEFPEFPLAGGGGRGLVGGNQQDSPRQTVLRGSNETKGMEISIPDLFASLLFRIVSVFGFCTVLPSNSSMLSL